MNEQTRVGNVFDGNPEQVREQREARVANRKSLLEWIQNSMKEGVDYGKIHKNPNCRDGDSCKVASHFSKECLLKPGAEKIQGYLGMVVQFTLISQNKDAVVIKAQAYDQSERLVGEGMGAREAHEDDNLNTAIKMAEKSAFVDVVLRAACLSEVFTQDLDTLKIKPDASAAAAKKPAAPAVAAATAQPASTAATDPEPSAKTPETPAAKTLTPGGKTPDAPITPAQKTKIEQLLQDLKVTDAKKVRERLVANFGENRSTVESLNRQQASQIIRLLDDAAKKKKTDATAAPAPSAA
ncbi:MAG: hypothetical protein ACYDCF_08085 [Burkholderiales bacterium]